MQESAYWPSDGIRKSNSALSRGSLRDGTADGGCPHTAVTSFDSRRQGHPRHLGRDFFLLRYRGDRLADVAFRFLQGGDCLGSACAGGEHHECDRSAIA
jgi:hypothetical protein